MSRALLRSVLELRAPVTRLTPSIRPPPTTTTTTTTPATLKPRTAAAVPSAARFFNQTAQHVEPTQPDPTVIAASQQSPAAPTSSPPQQPHQPAGPQAPLSESVRQLLPVLAAQPAQYIRIHIHGRPYLVTQGDAIRLPFKMRGVEPGNVLRLDRASVLGSRDLTLRGAPYVDPRLFECRAVVTGTESEPMRVMIKKKRRCRRAKHVKSKHRYTMLRVCELRVRTEAVHEA